LKGSDKKTGGVPVILTFPPLMSDALPALHLSDTINLSGIIKALSSQYFVLLSCGMNISIEKSCGFMGLIPSRVLYSILAKP
jgi:hypothetical protein